MNPRDIILAVVFSPFLLVPGPLGRVFFAFVIAGFRHAGHGTCRLQRARSDTAPDAAHADRHLRQP